MKGLDEPSLMHIRKASLLQPSTRLEHSLEQIKAWERDCQEQHGECNKRVPYTPPRLLDTMLENDSLVKLVQLPCATVEAPKYACLSHCWGKTRSDRITKRNNLEMNMQGIPVNHLPQTFRDAIQVARALSIPYLWIDSLCIVQDSESDWKMHVSAMAQIYASAHITIAAGVSTDDDGGIFTELSESGAKCRSFTLEISENKKIQLYFRRKIDHMNADWPSKEILPIVTRGWCFQEHLLSWRYLLFSSKEVLWECQEAVGCTCSMTDRSFNEIHPLGSYPRFPGCGSVKAELSAMDRTKRISNPISTWRNMITMYSSRKLTFESDKLPALAGLASFFLNRANLGIYLNGMWGRSIRSEIAWKYTGEEAPPGRPRNCPTWSWASAADGSICWPFLELYDSYTVQLQLSPREGKPEAYSYSLEISGLLLPVSIQTYAKRVKIETVFPLIRCCNIVEWNRRHSEPQLHLIHHLGSLVSTAPGSRSDRDADSHRVQSTEDFPRTNLSGEFYADYKFWTSEEELQIELQHVWFFFLGTEPDYGPYQSKGWGQEHQWIDGLVLKPADSRSISEDCIHQYERIGWLRYATRESPKQRTSKGFKSRFLLV